MGQNAYDESRERLLEAPCRIIDILPRQVPEACGGQWFAIEAYWMEHPQIDELYARFARLILKLNCYYDLAVYDPHADAWADDPAPAELARRVAACTAEGPDRYVHVLFPGEDALLTLEGDDLHMTLYDPRGGLLETATQLAASEGLFLRRPEIAALLDCEPLV